MTVETHLPPAGTESLDRRDLDTSLAHVTLRDIAMANVLFGGSRALRYGVRALCRQVPTGARLSVLDVGAGDGQATTGVGAAIGGDAQLVALDHLRAAARLCRARSVTPVVADMWHLPVAENGVDVVVANLVLHHVTRPEAVALLAQLHRTARLGVVVADLRRSAIAVAGFAIASRALGFHPVSRHDGRVSIQRGFTAAELTDLITEAGVMHPTVRRRPGWRLVAHWTKAHAHHR